MGSYKSISKWSTLDEFLEEEFIPKNAKCNKQEWRFCKNKFVESIKLSAIEKLGLEDEDFDYVMKYLSEQNICVFGTSPALYSDYENYFYIQNSSIPRSIEMPLEKQNEYIRLYQQNHNIEDRNKVIESYYSLVNSLAHKYAYITGIEQGDLFMAGFIGLIKAMEKVDPDKNPLKYFCITIKKNILREILIEQGLQNGYKNSDLYSLFLAARKKIAKDYEWDEDYDEYQHVEEIINELGLTFDERSKVDVGYIESLDKYREDPTLIDDNTLYDQVLEPIYQEELRLNLEDALEGVTYRQKMAVQKVDLEGISVNELAASFHVGHSTVSTNRQLAFKKLRKNKKLIEFQENESREYHFNPKNIEEGREKRGKVKTKK